MRPTVLHPLLVMLALVAGPADLAADAPRVRQIEVRLVPEESRVEVVDRIPTGADGPGPLRLNDGLVRPRATIAGEPVELVERAGAWHLAGTALPDAVLTLEYGFELQPDPDPAQPFLGPDAGFLPGWAGWLASTADLRAAYELRLEVALPQVAVATGDLVEESRKDGVYHGRFRMDHAGEPPSVFTGRWVVDERELDGVRFRTYLTPPTRDLADLYLERSAGYVARFEEQVGAYPYAGFAVVAAPIPVGLGFPGLTYVSERILPLPFMQTRSLAHEVLHGWFGNAIQVDYRTGNWAEGLTTYLADYGIQDDPAAKRAMRLGWLRDYNALPPDRDIVLRDFVVKGHDADQIVGYDKAAFVFHMLRRRLGEARFEAGLQRFYEAHGFGRAGWSDLEASFEAASGQELGRFFSQWLERPGAPSLALEEARRATTGDGYQVELALSQSAPVYELRVPVRIETEEGSEQVSVPIESERTVVLIETDAAPLRVAVDPAFEVFRRLAPGEAPPILRDVLLDREARTVVLGDAGQADAATAGALAAALFGEEVEVTRSLDGVADDQPLLLIGRTAAVERALGQLGLGAPPPEVAGGTAAVWTVARDGGAPVLVVRADDRAALEALRRPLPHYRRDSWLRFDGDTATARGVWPAGSSALSVDLR